MSDTLIYLVTLGPFLPVIFVCATYWKTKNSPKPFDAYEQMMSAFWRTRGLAALYLCFWLLVWFDSDVVFKSDADKLFYDVIFYIGPGAALLELLGYGLFRAELRKKQNANSNLFGNLSGNNTKNVIKEFFHITFYVWMALAGMVLTALIISDTTK